jgi:hypothetical protein
MTLDLSAVTDSLLGLVKSQWTTAPIWTEVAGSPPAPTFTPSFTGLAPDAARQAPGPQLALYLYHVEPDNAREALFWQPQLASAQGGEPTRFLPLALNLYYLLFAYSETSYTEEQEAMSVALRVFHANPVVRSDPGAATPWELTLTMEHRSYDEMSRLWQATTAPLRMSQVYRAAVVFIDPDPAPAAAAPVSSFSVSVNPVPSPGPADFPVVFGTARDGSYAAPGGTVPFSQSPATLAAGQAASLLGSDLGITGVSDHVYLLPSAGGAELDITTWAIAAESSAATFALRAPAGAGAAPAGTPDPGVYQLRVGSGAAGTPSATRSNSTPVSVAALVHPPAGGPVLTGSPPFTVTGVGFVPGATEVLTGTVTLAGTGGPAASPGPGEVSVEESGTSFTFSPPAGPAGTVVPVRVRVNGIESDPAVWVML